MDINECTILVIELPPKNELRSKIEYHKKLIRYAKIKLRYEKFSILIFPIYVFMLEYLN
jgi:hypothetical protein